MLRDFLVFVLLGLLAVAVWIGCQPVQATDARPASEVAANPLLGGWYLVHGEYGDQVRAPAEPFQFKLFGADQFAFLMQSPDGEWNYSSTGRYELVGDGIYRETFEYSTVPEYRNMTADWAYHFSGDTLYVEGPLRLIDSAGNPATQYDSMLNTMWEARVRRSE